MATVKVYLGHSAIRFANIVWNAETAKVLSECARFDGVFYACFKTAEDVCRANEAL